MCQFQSVSFKSESISSDQFEIFARQKSKTFWQFPSRCVVHHVFLPTPRCHRVPKSEYGRPTGRSAKTASPSLSTLMVLCALISLTDSVYSKPSWPAEEVFGINLGSNGFRSCYR